MRASTDSDVDCRGRELENPFRGDASNGEGIGNPPFLCVSLDPSGRLYF